MSWSLRHKILYISVSACIAAILLFWFGNQILSRPATCFDNSQNQGELGIDCGGPCARICSQYVRDPIVVWARSFPVSSTTYTAAAYIENPNATIHAGAQNVHYVFRLLDAQNSLITEARGITNILPTQNTPIVVPKVTVGSRIVAHTFLDFSGTPPVWETISTSTDRELWVGNVSILPDGTRAEATLHNDGSNDVLSISVAAILYDGQNNALQASITKLDRLSAHSSQQLIFTWPAVSDAVRVEILPLPPLSS